MKNLHNSIASVGGSLVIFSLVYWCIHYLLGGQILGDAKFGDALVPFIITAVGIFLISFSMAAFGVCRIPLPCIFEVVGFLSFGLIFTGAFNQRENDHQPEDRLLLIISVSLALWDSFCYFTSRRIAAKRLNKNTFSLEKPER